MIESPCRILIIGYGSIGKRHAEVLRSLCPNSEIHVVSKHSAETNGFYRTLEEVPDLRVFDYFVVASETSKHHNDLMFIEQRVDSKVVLCEKPLFEKGYSCSPLNNKVYVGYNLRFHPLIKKLKNDLNNKELLSVRASCAQYLPSWRPHSDYRFSYSASQARGGGVLLDLSHEIDYLMWILGALEPFFVYSEKVSALEINSDDIFSFQGRAERCPFVSIYLDYLSHVATRSIFVSTNEETYSVDLIANKYMKKKKDSDQVELETVEINRNETYFKMHQSILTKQASDVCTFFEGMNTMSFVERLKNEY